MAELPTMVETRQAGFNQTKPTRAVLYSLHQTKTERSSTGPPRDSGTQGQLGPISDGLCHFLCFIKDH